MSYGAAPPGWYPDPGGAGQRYYDGSNWTGHVAPWAPPVQAAAYGWKGARYGRPAHGPGALADPGKRLLARILDGLVLLPVGLLCLAIMLALVLPHVGPIFPKETNDPNATFDASGFFTVYLAAIAVVFVQALFSIAYEAILTERYGRTLGKRWMRIRPVTVEGHALGTGKSWGRAGAVALANVLGWLGLLDSLWCLWDADSQCVHDKAVGTLVVND